jgi:hypothetical protein
VEDSIKDVVLQCEGCGERTVLGGPLSVWSSGHTSFSCECGARLTLSQQLGPSKPDKRAERRAAALHR